MTVSKMWNRWIQDGNMERYAGSQRQQVSARTIRRRLQQHRLSAQRPWLQLPLSLHHNHQDGRIRVWWNRGERTLSACIRHHHTNPSPGVMVWDAIGYTSLSILVHIDDTLNSARYISEREEKLLFEQLRLDEQKRKYEFELEKLRIQTQSKLGTDTSKESDTKFLVKEISKFIHRFDLKEDISLYLKLFERQAQRLNIDQENWVSHLLGLLPTEVSHIIAREPDDKANSYEHVKDLLLKRFKLTPEKFRQLFVTHQKAPERTWIDFYHELNTSTDG
ncbi:uncharacterized protein TNCV_2754611 [Trichonephila clavipes]|nr:uncharacterized protein TNCV_2754611 [Trichonephila clavipes]